MDRGTRRWFAVALIGLVAAVGLATFLLAAPSDAPPGDATSVDGVIVGVDSQSLSNVTSFELRASDGAIHRFGLALLENGTEFPPGHLLEHSVTAQPVRVWYRTVDGVDQAIRLEDAELGT